MPDNPQSQQTQTSSLDTFLDQVIVERHGAEISDAFRKRTREPLRKELDNWIKVKTLEELAKQSPQTLEEFQALAEDKDITQDKLEAFIKEKIPDQSTFMAQILLKFRNIYVGA